MTDSANIETPKSGRGFAITSLVLGILATVLVYPTPKIPLEDTKFNAVFFVVLSFAFGLASLFQSKKPKGMAVAGVLLAACSAFFLAFNWSSGNKAMPAISQAPRPQINAPIIEPSPVVKTTVESEWTPSYDCQKVASGPERMICSNKELSNLDVQLNEVYAQAAKRVNDRGALKGEQLAWLKNVRGRCSDADCMKHAYGLRLVELRAK
jgi:hypothetical protein